MKNKFKNNDYTVTFTSCMNENSSHGTISRYQKKELEDSDD